MPYELTDANGGKLPPLVFTIFWLSEASFHANVGIATPRIIGREHVKRHDLSGAITTAANKLKGNKPGTEYAAGFIVRAGKH